MTKALKDTIMLKAGHDLPKQESTAEQVCSNPYKKIPTSQKKCPKRTNRNYKNRQIKLKKQFGKGIKHLEGGPASGKCGSSACSARAWPREGREDRDTLRTKSAEPCDASSLGKKAGEHRDTTGPNNHTKQVKNMGERKRR